jgi:two-component system CheB/CheR fusion protein
MPRLRYHRFDFMKRRLLNLLTAASLPLLLSEANRQVGTMGAMGALRILYVEDHPDSREAMERLLRHNGHDVRGVGSVGEALAAAAKERFDLLIADVTLPDGDGCELLIRLRSAHPTLRAVAVTGHDREELLKECRAAGFSEFVTKPVSFSTLLAAVDAARAP